MSNSFYNKKVLIIGGTGTIGQQLLKAILDQQPYVVRILSRDEHKQFELQQQMQHYSNIRYLIGDVRDYQRLVRAMEGVDYVFHLAAMKHVPFCEYNPFEAVQTNVIGTQNVIQASIFCDVRKVLFTSTDKAISPANTYGATKLMAEKLICAAEYHKGSKNTIFSSVRFGNVMGSRGSVIPLFKNQIMERHEITVTDMNMSRYMMTPKQAVSLLMEAHGLAQGGEVFVLKMPVVKLSDLINVIVELHSKYYRADDSVKIKEIGLRPGEKMFEELMTEDEARCALELPNMFIIPSMFSQKSNHYPGVITDGSFKFSSRLQPPIKMETLREWFMDENLF